MNIIRSMIGSMSGDVTEKEAEKLVKNMSTDKTILKESSKEAIDLIKTVQKMSPNIANLEFKTDANRTENILNLLKTMSSLESKQIMYEPEKVADLLHIAKEDRQRFIIEYKIILEKAQESTGILRTIMGWILTVMFNYVRSQWQHLLLLICIMWIFKLLKRKIYEIRRDFANWIHPQGAIVSLNDSFSNIVDSVMTVFRQKSKMKQKYRQRRRYSA